MNTESLSYAGRLERLNTYIAEGRVLRGKWRTTEADGRELACLLAALSPEAGLAGAASACPASVMPEWLAHLTPRIDDNVSAAYWPEMLHEYAACAALWPKLDDKAWRRVQAKMLVATLDVALPNAGSAKPAVEAVRALLVRASFGDEPPTAAWGEARAAAWAARAAEAVEAVEAAAWAAARAAEAVEAVEAAAWAAAWAARAEAAVLDAITKALFAAIRQEAAAVEGVMP